VFKKKGCKFVPELGRRVLSKNEEMPLRKLTDVRKVFHLQYVILPLLCLSSVRDSPLLYTQQGHNLALRRTADQSL
jgi:hypothetical protein